MMHREGLPQPFNDKQFSGICYPGCYQGITYALILASSTTPEYQRQWPGTASNTWFKFNLLPLACSNCSSTYFEVAHCRNSAAKLQATCSTRTAQLGTEECVRNVIKSDLSRLLPQTETKAALRQAAASSDSCTTLNRNGKRKNIKGLYMVLIWVMCISTSSAS